MSQSVKIYEEACQFIPGGVNSPVRAFRSVGGTPVVLTEGAGARVTDADGRVYLDYVGSWGPLILGHAPACVQEAVSRQLRRGTTFGMLTPGEVELARLLCEATPCLEKVRLVSSGTEAVMAALRVARAFTGRSRIVKFDGGYHGHADGLLSKAGSGLATLGIPTSPGVPEEFAALTITIPFNDLNALAAALKHNEVACLIGEPIPGNMGVVPPQPGFWNEAARMVRDAGALLIFDEVITGFRAGWNSAQGVLGVTPDLATFGKIIGGGLPLGAFGGRAEIMKQVAPEGPVYQAGTLSGNPLAVAAGLAALRTLQATQPYATLDARAARLEAGLRSAARGVVPVSIQRAGSLLTVFFHEGEVPDFETASRSDTKAYAKFFHACLARGILLPPSQFEAWFLSTAHTDEDVDHTVEIARTAFAEAAR